MIPDNDARRPLTVLYDGSMFTSQHAGGVNRYFERIIGGLPSDWTPVLTTAEMREENFPAHPRLRVVHWKRYGFRPGRVSFALEPLVFGAAERIAAPDVFHPTTYRRLTRRPFAAARRPMVVTVWDMIHERFASAMDPHGSMAAAKREAVAAADAVLCISECTRRDVVELLGVPEERLVVTHLAAGIDGAGAGPPVGGPPFLLHVGSRAAGYKNFDRFIAAFGRLSARHPDLRLRIVGKPLDADEERWVDAARVRDRLVFEGVVDDARLAALYRDAVALVYPSLYEGFGIPPLEAAACGGVAAVSRVASLPEVMGEAAAWFDPSDVDDMADVLDRLVGDPGFRDGLAARGPERAARFSWDATAARTAELYRALAR